MFHNTEICSSQGGGLCLFAKSSHVKGSVWPGTASATQQNDLCCFIGLTITLSLKLSIFTVSVFIHWILLTPTTDH